MSRSLDPPVALLDANVLFPQFLRDVLLRLAVARLFSPRWTDRIQNEWTGNLIAKRPDVTREAVQRTRKLMEVAFPQARVTGYRRHEKSFAGIHAGDRHVAAAAAAAGATQIVTFNLRHFPHDALAPFAIEAVHPDAFISAFLSLDRDQVVKILEKHRAGLRRPALSPSQYRAAFRKTGLIASAEYLSED